MRREYGKSAFLTRGGGLIAGVISCILVASCAAPAGLPRDTPPAAPVGASAHTTYSFGPASNLIRSDGKVIGSARTSPWPQSVALGIVANGMTPGAYRLYLHAAGRCDPPDFSSSGPAQVGEYGRLAPPDLGTVTVAPDGRIYMTKLAYGMKLRPSDQGDLPVLLDLDGASLVVQADNRRVACAVLR